MGYLPYQLVQDDVFRQQYVGGVFPLENVASLLSKHIAPFP